MLRFLTITLVGLMLSAGTAMAGPKALTDAELEDVNAQGLQLIMNDNRAFSPPLSDQNNNLDSVQLNSSAQQNSRVAGIVNSAKSAVNASANILRVGNVTDGGNGNKDTIIQSNTNIATNHQNVAVALSSEGENTAFASNLNKQTQFVENTPVSQVDGQNNNNNSVQLNDDAQQNSLGVSIMNASTSAVNFALNVVTASSLSDTVIQSNSQVATNMSNLATATGLADASNGEFSSATQTINNHYGVDGDTLSSVRNQNNNNNSVQANDNAQEYASVGSLLNSAQSAVNISGNLASLGTVSDSSLIQSNTNSSSNHNNIAFASNMAFASNLNKQTQNVENAPAPLPEYEGLATIYNQNNNNNSVQANDNAQRAVQALLLENAASSATNAALNMLSTGGLSGSHVAQSNQQSASNYENEAISSVGLAVAGNMEVSWAPGQYIHNVHATIDQDNNNNSVQLNGNAQSDTVVDKLINSANSAVNAAQNLMHTGDVANSTIVQSNSQYAGNHNNNAWGWNAARAINLNKQTQIIENCWCTDLSEGHTQDNNMNSTQLNDNAQQNSTGTLVVNAADSAVNGALNLLAATAVTDSSIVQSNTNVAVNFSNTSVSTGMATSANAEGMIFFPGVPLL